MISHYPQPTVSHSGGWMAAGREEGRWGWTVKSITNTEGLVHGHKLSFLLKSLINSQAFLYESMWWVSVLFRLRTDLDAIWVPPPRSTIQPFGVIHLCNPFTRFATPPSLFSSIACVTVCLRAEPRRWGWRLHNGLWLILSGDCYNRMTDPVHLAFVQADTWREGDIFFTK